MLNFLCLLILKDTVYYYNKIYGDGQQHRENMENGADMEKKTNKRMQQRQEYAEKIKEKMKKSENADPEMLEKLVTLKMNQQELNKVTKKLELSKSNININIRRTRELEDRRLLLQNSTYEFERNQEARSLLENISSSTDDDINNEINENIQRQMEKYKTKLAIQRRKANKYFHADMRHFKRGPEKAKNATVKVKDLTVETKTTTVDVAKKTASKVKTSIKKSHTKTETDIKTDTKTETDTKTKIDTKTKTDTKSLERPAEYFAGFPVKYVRYPPL